MTPGDRFTLIILAITLMTSVLAYLIKRTMSGWDDGQERITKRLDSLSEDVKRMGLRQSRMEGILRIPPDGMDGYFAD